MQSTQLQTSADGTVKVSGVLTFATVNQLWEQSQSFFALAQNTINFDLANVIQSDSAGVALLLAWARTAHAHNKQIQFKSLPEQMQAIARVSGLEGVIGLGK